MGLPFSAVRLSRGLEKQYKFIFPMVSVLLAIFWLSHVGGCFYFVYMRESPTTEGWRVEWNEVLQTDDFISSSPTGSEEGREGTSNQLQSIREGDHKEDEGKRKEEKKGEESENWIEMKQLNDRKVKMRKKKRKCPPTRKILTQDFGLCGQKKKQNNDDADTDKVEHTDRQS